MTRYSDKEHDEQSDEEEETPDKNRKKRGKAEKHVTFPPDEQIVSGFAENNNANRSGKMFFKYIFKSVLTC